MFPPQHIISWLNFLAGDSSGLAVNGSMSLLAARSFFLAKLWSHAHGELGGAYGRYEVLVLAHHPFLVTALQFELEIPHPTLGHGGHQCPMSPGAGRTSSHGGTFPCGVQGEMGERGCRMLQEWHSAPKLGTVHRTPIHTPLPKPIYCLTASQICGSAGDNASPGRKHFHLKNQCIRRHSCL